jgi:potassium/hydrogen antiporter
MTLEQLDSMLLVGVAVLLVSIAAVRLSTGAGLPSLLAYLAVGLLIGEDGLGVEFDDVALTRTLGTAALIVILIEGGPRNGGISGPWCRPPRCWRRWASR